jgi:phospholipase/carboxylesterase
MKTNSASSADDPALGFVHRFLPAENGSVASAPTLLLLHGTGGNENQMIAFGRQMAGAGWNLLSPRGKVLEGGHSPRFFRRLAEGVFDEADVVRRADELADFASAAAAHYGFDARAIFALGYSNGANIAAAVLLLRPSTLAGAALLRPMVPLTPLLLPSLPGTPILMCAGRHDPIVPTENVAELGTLFQQCGAQVRVSWSSGGHELAEADAEVISRWLPEVARGPLAAHAIT